MAFRPRGRTTSPGPYRKDTLQNTDTVRTQKNRLGMEFEGMLGSRLSTGCKWYTGGDPNTRLMRITQF